MMMRRFPLFAAVLGVFCCAVLLARAVAAQSDDPPVVVTVSADTFTDRLQSTTAHNGMGLQLQANDPAPASGAAVKVAFLKFDLSGVSFPNGGAINRVTLVLPAPGGAGCPTPAPSLPLVLYGASTDAWTNNLTWGADRNAPTHPARSPATPLATLDQGSVGATPAVMTFTDDSNGPLAQFAEAERVGDGTMSLRLEIDSGTGNVVFNDSEDSAAGTPTCLLPAERTPYLALQSDTPTAIVTRSGMAQALSWAPLLVVLAILLTVATSIAALRRNKPV